MTYSEQTMRAMDKALGYAKWEALLQKGRDILADEAPMEFRIEDTCCGKCPIGTTCYVDQLTGA